MKNWNLKKRTWAQADYITNVSADLNASPSE